MSVIADCGFRSWGKWITRHWKTCGVFKRLKIAYKTIPVCLLAIRPSTRSKCKPTKERRLFFRVPNRWSSARGQLPRQFFACLLAVSWYQHRTAPLGSSPRRDQPPLSVQNQRGKERDGEVSVENTLRWKFPCG